MDRSKLKQLKGVRDIGKYPIPLKALVHMVFIGFSLHINVVGTP